MHAGYLVVLECPRVVNICSKAVNLMFFCKVPSNAQSPHDSDDCASGLIYTSVGSFWLNRNIRPYSASIGLTLWQVSLSLVLPHGT